MEILNPAANADKPAGLVIIGTGLAGYHTAKQWRLIDSTASLTIITADEGAFYSKPQLSTLQAKGKAPESLITKTAEQMAADLNAMIYAHTQVESIDRKQQCVCLADGTAIAFQQLVLATGAKVHTLALPEQQLKHLFSINSLQDYQRLQQQLVQQPEAKVIIIGSGLVGCELANDLHHAGHQVTIMTNDAYPMRCMVPEALGKVFQKHYAAAGVDFIFNAAVARIEKNSDTYSVHLAGQTLTADIVISAIGLKPNVLLAEQAGLTIDHGIMVDQQFRTSDPVIYAIGDCAVVKDHWRPYIAPVLHGGKVLAKVLAGEAAQSIQYPHMPIIAKTNLCKVQGVYDHPSKMQQYQLTIDDTSTKAFYHDDNGNLKAFVLIGDAVTERTEWMAKLA